MSAPPASARIDVPHRFEHSTLIVCLPYSLTPSECGDLFESLWDDGWGLQLEFGGPVGEGMKEFHFKREAEA